MTKILVATDGSAHAEAAAAAAKRLFTGPGQTFTVMTVAHTPTNPAAYPYPLMNVGLDLLPAQTLTDMEAGVRIQSERIVSETASILGEGTETRVDWGATGRTICDTARAIGADVIVLGDHGHGWLGDRLMGSVARYVTHHTPCAVFINREPEQ